MRVGNVFVSLDAFSTGSDITRTAFLEKFAIATVFYLPRQATHAGLGICRALPAQRPSISLESDRADTTFTGLIILAPLSSTHLAGCAVLTT